MSLFAKADANFVYEAERARAGGWKRAHTTSLAAALGRARGLWGAAEESAAGKGGKALLTIPPSLLMRAYQVIE